MSLDAAAAAGQATAGQAVSVTAEWALHGIPPGGLSGGRLIACSDGELSGRNFEDALQRFSPGTLDQLPQASISYLPRAGDPTGGYLALAIHTYEEAAGRRQPQTSYFCVGYQALAKDMTTYRSLHEAFRTIALPAANGPPLTVELPRPAPRAPLAPPYDDLAVKVAALLLMAPVCVLGAERAAMSDRLEFVDAVMALLPYGLRARMTASTWVRGTQRTHRFRLFFSDAPRTGEGRDQVVIWDHPEQATISAEHQHAADYYAWLEDRVHLRTRLAGLTGHLRFGHEHIGHVLDQVGVASRADGPADAAEPGPGPDHRALPVVTAPLATDSFTAASFTAGTTAEQPGRAAAVLLSLATHTSARNIVELRADIAALQALVEAGPEVPGSEREQLQAIIAEHGLLRLALPPGRLDAGSYGRLYDGLLRLAFGVPIGYAGYCRITGCLNPNGSPANPSAGPRANPSRALLQAVERAGLADPRVTALVFWHLDKRRLDDWLSTGISTGELIALVAGEWHRPEHARIMCDAALRQVPKLVGRNSQLKLRTALRAQGYLAQALHGQFADAMEYQVETLHKFLAAGYRHGLDQHAVIEVLGAAGPPPTPALLSAVLLSLVSRTDAELAADLYVRALIARSSLSASTRAQLTKMLPPPAETVGDASVPRGLI